MCSDLEVVIIDCRIFKGKSVLHMLGENLEIVPPPFRDMLEDDKKVQDKLSSNKYLNVKWDFRLCQQSV